MDIRELEQKKEMLHKYSGTVAAKDQSAVDVHAAASHHGHAPGPDRYGVVSWCLRYTNEMGFLQLLSASSSAALVRRRAAFHVSDLLNAGTVTTAGGFAFLAELLRGNRLT
jgi:hypothetical protein